MEKKKILIVDDEVAITDLVKAYLEQTSKYEICVGNSGAEALNASKTFHPELIVMDVDIPDMDGPEVAEAMRNDVSTRGIPIVFLSSIVSEKEVEDSHGVIGGRRFLAKPVNRQKLIDCIEKVINESAARK
jgi:CheY-like chemotaxis protein